MADGLHGVFKSAPITLTIVRHGATKLNGESGVSVDRERGWSDVPLMAEGREEAREAAAKLKGKGIGAIVSSDLVRAKQTAQIIGGALEIKPEFSYELRPWNLGDLTGKAMDEASPQIRAYAEKPDEEVPGGESFKTFVRRAFDGLHDAVEQHHGEKVLIVAHHRIERLIAGWDKADQPADHAIDIPTFMQDGGAPGGIIELKTSEAALQGQDADYGAGGYAGDGQAPGAPAKLSHAQVHYGLAKGADKCAACKSYQGKDACLKVVAPIYPGGWCAVGHSKADGHPYDPSGDQIEQEARETPGQEMAESPGQQAAEQRAGVERGGDAMAHGRAIAGAKALHAVGHITAKERDHHVAASRQAMGQAAPRKPFGSFAPR